MKHMSRRRFTTIASRSAVAALGLSLGSAVYLGGAVSSEAAIAHGASAATATRYVVLSCTDKAQVKPGTIYLACADDGLGLTRLHWTSWTPELASAYGTLWENDCKPNCAQGHIHYYPVVAVLWGGATVAGHRSERRYTEVTVSFTKHRPPVYVVNGNGKVVATYPVSQTLPLAG
jgi:hypothetical protein